MKVAFLFSSKGLGGGERSMLRMIKEIHPQRVECSVIHLAPPNTQFRDVFVEAKIPFYQLNTLSTVGLMRLFQELHPDIVFLFGQIRTVIWATVAKAAGVPVVLGAEIGSGTRWINRYGRKLDRFFLDGYIANTKKTAKRLEALGIPGERVFPVYYGLDMRKLLFGNSTVDKQPLGDPMVLCVANLRPNKGQIVLVRAIKLLRPRFPNIRAVLIGEDMTEGNFAEEARAEGLDEYYRHLGFVNEVAPYLRSADLCVLPTLFREGMPTALMEAMYAGVPVIASDVGGVDELVIDGETGLLVQPGDPVQLASKIEVLLTQPALYQRLRDRARAHVEAHHTLESMIDGHLKVFQTLLNGKQAS